MPRGTVYEVQGVRGTLSELAVHFRLPLAAVQSRRHQGWPLEEAFTKPYVPRGPRKSKSPTVRSADGRPLTATQKLPDDVPARPMPDPSPSEAVGPLREPPAGTRFVDAPEDAFELEGGRRLGLAPGYKRPGPFFPGDLEARTVRWLTFLPRSGVPDAAEKVEPVKLSARVLLLEELAATDVELSRLTAKRAKILTSLTAVKRVG